MIAHQYAFDKVFVLQPEEILHRAVLCGEEFALDLDAACERTAQLCAAAREVRRDVIVVDDALESGGTMKRLVAHLEAYQPASLAVATLFVKPGRVAIPVRQYYGFEMDSDELLVGFGLPWRDQLRNLPYVARLNADGV